MSYQLFYSPGACSLAVHIILEEVDTDFTLHHVSVPNGETMREPYLSINPKGRVPALRIDGEPSVLTELPAILIYLAHRHHEHGLMPNDNSMAAARCAELLAWLSGWVHGVGFGLLWRPERFSTDPSHYDALRAQGRAIVEAAYMNIERQLEANLAWASGDSFSIVDPFLVVLYRWGNRIGLPMAPLFPSWATLTERAVARPAVLRALSTEGVSIDI